VKVPDARSIAVAQFEPPMRSSAGAESIADSDLESFIAAHYDRLIRLAMLVCREPTDAADAVQSGLEQAWRKRSSLRDETRLKPWLDRIVVREAIHAGKRRTSLLGRVFGGPANVGWIEPSGDDRPRIALRDTLREAFGGLSAEQRAVVVLHLHLGYSVAEVADLVGAPQETVRSRLRLARARLRQVLQETDR
jgi:RNA polymerase sigma-70 factor (ECF subfamily)